MIYIPLALLGLFLLFLLGVTYKVSRDKVKALNDYLARLQDTPPNDDPH